MLKNDKIEGIKYEKVDIHHLNPKSITMGQLCDLRVLRCCGAFHATRVRRTRPGVVSFLRKRPFGPRRDRDRRRVAMRSEPAQIWTTSS